MDSEAQIAAVVLVGVLALFLGLISLCNANAADRRIQETQRFESCMTAPGVDKEACILVLGR